MGRTSTHTRHLNLEEYTSTYPRATSGGTGRQPPAIRLLRLHALQPRKL